MRVDTGFGKIFTDGRFKQRDVRSGGGARQELATRPLFRIQAVEQSAVPGRPLPALSVCALR